LDKSREQFSSKDYDIMTQDNLLRAFMSINMDCGMLNNLEPAKTNPASI